MSASAIESRGVAHATELHVERTGIRYWNVAPDRVRIEVLVENWGADVSRPASLVLQAAAFGAFVPWQPLARLAVPSLEPGGVAVVGCERPQRRVRAVADFSGLVPPRLRTALGASGGDSEGVPAASPTRARDQVMASALQAMMRSSARSGELPPDLLELLGQENPHWAGNINVLVGGRSVERHMAQALRVYPGRANLAMFMLGGDATGYRMEARGEGALWPHALFDPLVVRPLLQPDGSFQLDLEWSRIDQRMVVFACRPPLEVGAASVEIHVQRQPQGDEAVVEFSLSPDAAGPGCYAV